MRSHLLILAAVAAAALATVPAHAARRHWPDPPAWWLNSPQMVCVRYRESTDGQASPNVYQMTSPGGWPDTGGKGSADYASRAEQDYRAWLLWLAEGCHRPWGQYDGCC